MVANAIQVIKTISSLGRKPGSLNLLKIQRELLARLARCNRFEGFRLQLAISLQQDFHFAFGFLQFLAAGAGEFHAFIEKFQSMVEGDISLFQFGHDFFQSFETLFELGQAQTPVNNSSPEGITDECENSGVTGRCGKYFSGENLRPLRS